VCGTEGIRIGVGSFVENGPKAKAASCIVGVMSTAPPAIRGLHCIEHPRSPGLFECAFTPDADAQTIDALLLAIGPRSGLQFFDYLYHGEPPPREQPMDEGAIVCVWRDERGALFATCGNHGWSSKWTPVTHEQLATFLAGCMDSNRGDSGRSQKMRLGLGAAFRPRPDDIDPKAPILVRKDLSRKGRGPKP
jgi:hypothetical protein